MSGFRFCLMLAVILLSVPFALAQSRTFEDANVDYTFALPGDAWRIVARPDNLRAQTEIVYIDRMDGLLRIKRETLDDNEALADAVRDERDSKLRFLPGYVDGKEERFSGELTGVTFSYEFTQSGKQMVGRTYFLKADGRTFYALRFTGQREKLAAIRNQTDAIARSFKVKQP